MCKEKIKVIKNHAILNKEEADKKFKKEMLKKCMAHGVMLSI